MTTNDFSVRTTYKPFGGDREDVYTISPDGSKFAFRKNGECVPTDMIPAAAGLALRRHGLSLRTIREEEANFNDSRKSGYDQAREEIREQIIEYFGKPKPDEVQQIDKVNDLLDALSLPQYEAKRTFTVTATDPGNGEVAFRLTVIADDESEAQETAEEVITFNRRYEEFAAVEVDINDACDDDRVVDMDTADGNYETEVEVADLVDEWLKSLRYRATEEL